MIKTENLVKKYTVSGRNKFCALKGVDLQIDEGELVAVIGESGAGKSTLLHILACIETFEQGDYYIDGVNIKNYNDKKLSYLRSHIVSIVLQNFMLLEDVSVLNNVMLPLRFNKEIKDKRRAAEQALERVGLAHLAKRRAKQLSGGQKQRVAIARAVVTQPKYIFADEPTGALDSKTSQEIMDLLTELNRQGMAVIIVTHNPKIADQCSRVIEISDGEIIRDERR